MANIKGIVVELKTGSESWAGTDNFLYLGVAGTNGGREFALDVSGFDDFKVDSKVNYIIGESFGIDPSGPEKVPRSSPSTLTKGSQIGQPSVTQVYLRKYGGTDEDADDAWRLS